ncbi:MAG: TlpA family protein disulfide reductase [Deltaproteobacteria bacterium]|nr:TlpA family protein disulfide reductase [Deltaproteobacteria bacterium]
MIRMLASLLLLQSLSAPASGGLPGPGDPAPDFGLRDRERRLVRLSDHAYPGPERPGKPRRAVLLDFFRTDCAPCRRELPLVVAWHEAHRDETQVFLVALLEPEDGAAKLDAFLRENPVPFPVLLDPYEVAAKLYITEGSSVTLPCIVQVSGEGTILRRVQELQTDLERALSPGEGTAP